MYSQFPCELDVIGQLCVFSKGSLSFDLERLMHFTTEVSAVDHKSVDHELTYQNAQRNF